MLFIDLLCCTVSFTIVFVYFRRGGGGAIFLPYSTPTTEGEFDSIFLILFFFLAMKQSSNIYTLPKIFLFYCMWVCVLFCLKYILYFYRSPFPSLIRGKILGGGGTSARFQRRPPACVRTYVVTNRWSKALYLVVCVWECVCMLSEIKSAAGAKCFYLLCNMPLCSRPVSKVSSVFGQNPGYFSLFRKLSSSGRPVECVYVFDWIKRGRLGALRTDNRPLALTDRR